MGMDSGIQGFRMVVDISDFWASASLFFGD
jgi:hypothetical protein